jgi:exodeoxyribonuclease VII large subunit
MTRERSEDPPVRTILTPSALNRQVRDLIEDSLALVWIEGELSNVSRPASGHLYFTLKDATAQVRGAMFKPRSSWLPFKPADGMQVLLRARVSLYEARGEFQLVAEHMEPAGEGALRREFDRLKARLAAEGLFDLARKRALPPMPRRIAVVTSPSGAAIRDVLSVLARRFPLVEVDVVPVPVQGSEAPAAIVLALQRLALAHRHDVILLTRGGGSLEDLWAFNDEAVAHAIAASPVPVVSAIGHEVDVTIADFVADLRAPTPSAAAELLVPDRSDLERGLQRQHERLISRLRSRLQGAAQRLDHLHARLQANRPTRRLERGHERLAALRMRLSQVARRDRERHAARIARLGTALRARDPRLRIVRDGAALSAINDRLRAGIAHALERRRLHLDALARALHATGPLATLARGYAILVDTRTASVVRSRQDLGAGSVVRAILADGEVTLRVDAPD